MNRRDALQRLTEARVGRIATIDELGRPHVVPLVFAVRWPSMYWAVDDKPKRTKELRRLRNIRVNREVQVVVDGYEEDWRALWWVRASGPAIILPEGDEAERGRALLAAKYPQHAERRPPGPVVAVALERLAWWPRSGDEPSAGTG